MGNVLSQLGFGGGRGNIKVKENYLGENEFQKPLEDILGLLASEANQQRAQRNLMFGGAGYGGSFQTADQRAARAQGKSVNPKPYGGWGGYGSGNPVMSWDPTNTRPGWSNGTPVYPPTGGGDVATGGAPVPIGGGTDVATGGTGGWGTGNAVPIGGDPVGGGWGRRPLGPESRGGYGTGSAAQAPINEIYTETTAGGQRAAPPSGYDQTATASGGADAWKKYYNPPGAKPSIDKASSEGGARVLAKLEAMGVDPNRLRSFQGANIDFALMRGATPDQLAQQYFDSFKEAGNGDVNAGAFNVLTASHSQGLVDVDPSRLKRPAATTTATTATPTSGKGQAVSLEQPGMTATAPAGAGQPNQFGGGLPSNPDPGKSYTDEDGNVFHWTGHVWEGGPAPTSWGGGGGGNTGEPGPPATGGGGGGGGGAAGAGGDPTTWPDWQQRLYKNFIAMVKQKDPKQFENLGEGALADYFKWYMTTGGGGDGSTHALSGIVDSIVNPQGSADRPQRPSQFGPQGFNPTTDANGNPLNPAEELTTGGYAGGDAWSTSPDWRPEEPTGGLYGAYTELASGQLTPYENRILEAWQGRSTNPMGWADTETQNAINEFAKKPGRGEDEAYGAYNKMLQGGYSPAEQDAITQQGMATARAGYESNRDAMIRNQARTGNSAGYAANMAKMARDFGNTMGAQGRQNQIDFANEAQRRSETGASGMTNLAQLASTKGQATIGARQSFGNELARRQETGIQGMQSAANTARGLQQQGLAGLHALYQGQDPTAVLSQAANIAGKPRETYTESGSASGGI